MSAYDTITIPCTECSGAHFCMADECDHEVCEECSGYGEVERDPWDVVKAPNLWPHISTRELAALLLWAEADGSDTVTVRALRGAFVIKACLVRRDGAMFKVRDRLIAHPVEAWKAMKEVA